MAEHTEAERIRRVLQRAVARICPNWLQSTRDDLVQNAILKLVEKNAFADQHDAVNSSYLYKTAHSVMIDEIRRVRRRAESALDNTEPLEDPKSAGPYQTTLGSKISAAIRACLQRLAESRCMAVTLYLQGHKIPEIAKLLGWKKKQADNNVYRGLSDLRHCLREKGFDPQ